MGTDHVSGIDYLAAFSVLSVSRMARILCHGVDSPVWASCATKPRTLQGTLSVFRGTNGRGQLLSGAETRVALVDVRGITKASSAHIGGFDVV